MAAVPDIHRELALLGAQERHHWRSLGQVARNDGSDEAFHAAFVAWNATVLAIDTLTLRLIGADMPVDG